ncbi:MAG: NAD-dependent succinate-semialdehyde dehydrogenase [Microbacterium sp.]
MTAQKTEALRHAPTGILTDNVFRRSSNGSEFAVHDPATGEVVAMMADGSVEDAIAAVQSASSAQRRWAATPASDRADILRRAYELIIERREDLAMLMTLEMGKPLAESEAEVVYGAQYLRWFSEEAVRFSGRIMASPAGDSQIITIQQPVGPCLLVTPWNFPLAMGTRKIGPALAAGCTVIVKPAELTPLSMNALAAILIEAGLPEGVLSVLPTTSSPAVVSAIMADSRMRKISFTGSTEVGKMLIRQSADNVLRVSMELGGNAPFIVCSSADVSHAVDEAMKAKLRNNGEACTAANVLYVHADVTEQFSSELALRFDSLVVGPGYDPDTTVGPIIDQRAVEKLGDLLQDALRLGARVLSQRPIPVDTTGTYFPPTLLTDVPREARVVKEEIFGPIAPIVVWHDAEDLVRDINANEVGLAAYLFTRDLDEMRVLTDRLEVGMIGINRGVLSNVAAPFGGVKQSGYGREGSSLGIDEYLEVKYVAISDARSHAAHPPPR